MLLGVNTTCLISSSTPSIQIKRLSTFLFCSFFLSLCVGCWWFDYSVIEHTKKQGTTRDNPLRLWINGPSGLVVFSFHEHAWPDLFLWWCRKIDHLNRLLKWDLFVRKRTVPLAPVFFSASSMRELLSKLLSIKATVVERKNFKFSSD